jgi:2-polyprenyl-6-methoxyphenol hydroxylase-like FAD-dependent oxidoreductase
MPPGGQSVGLALEDSIILSRLLSSTTSSDVAEVFNRYHSIRRARVEDHYKQMASRWQGTKTRSWWVQKIMEFFVWIYLVAIARHADESFTYDPTKIDL